MPVSRPAWIEVGKVARAHGVRGEVRVLASTDNPERFQAGAVLYGRPAKSPLAPSRAGQGTQAGTDGRRALTIAEIRAEADFPIVRFAEVASREQAEALRGYILDVPSAQLPELEGDEYYPFDLAGLKVRDDQGRWRGKVKEALESPAHALLVVALSETGPAEGAGEAAGRPTEDKGREVLVPFVRAAVPEVQLQEGFLVVDRQFLL